MRNKIQKLRTFIVLGCNDSRFVHHKWFVKYHLDIVHQIAMELCDIYAEANREIVEVLVWMHDFEKIFKSQSLNKSLF